MNTRSWLSSPYKVVCAALVLVTGLLFQIGTADARLIFTTEGDGTLIDQDLDGDSNFSLFFGTNLSEEIEFDTANDRFNISNDIRVTGNAVTTGGVDIEGAAGLTLQNDETITNTVDGTINVNATTTEFTGGVDVQGGDIVLENDEIISNSSDGVIDITATTTATSGAVNVGGALDVQGGDITLQNDETISNSVDGNVSINATNTQVTGAFDVQGGDITLQNDETISNSVDGTVSITANNTTVSGALDVQGGDITLENDETISNSTDGTIDITATNTDVSNNLNVGNNLDVTGTSTLDGDVTLNADAQIINLRAENAATAGAPACADASDLGRIFYDTDTETLKYCKDTGSGFGFVSTSVAGTSNVNQTFVPEFGSFAVLADGSNNIGTLTAEFDDTANHGYYQWTTRQTALNDYDLVVQWKVPEDFDSFQTNALTFTLKTATTTAADNQIDVSGEDTAGTAMTLSVAANDAVSTVADTWEDVNVTITGGTFTTGELANFKFKVQADNTSNGVTSLGPVKVNYVSSN